MYNVYDYYKFGNTVFGNLPTLIEFMIFIVVIIFFLFEKMKFSISQPIYETINFWICVGLFVYFTGNFFYILLVENSKNNDPVLKNELMIIYSSVTIGKNLILSFSMVKKQEIDKSSNSNFLNIPSELNLDSFYPNNNLN